jgi:hypothetical protein
MKESPGLTSEEGRLIASRKQDRPVHRAFRLLCASLTCLLLLISTSSTPSSAGTSVKVLRCGSQKAAGYSSAFADIDGRKRAVAGEVTPLDGASSDLACPAAEDILPIGEAGIVAAAFSSCLFGSSRIEYRRARAPPLRFA